jgi:hypothetical protein
VLHAGLLPLLAVFALAQPPLVAVRPSAEAHCPSAVEVEAALLARLPGVVVPFDRAGERHALQLALGPSAEATAAELTLTDADGRIRLRRFLAAAGEKHDCGALAETAALMVERYLVELDERAASAARAEVAPTPVASVVPVPEPDPLWSLAVSGAYAAGPLRGDAFDLGLRATRQLGAGSDWLGHARIGAGPGFDPIPSDSGYDGVAQVRRFPVEIGLSWQRPLGRWALEAGAGGGFDVHQVRVAVVPGSEIAETLLAPQVFAEVAARMDLTRQIFLRMGTAAVVHWLRYDFSRSDLMEGEEAEPGGAVFSLPAQRIQARITVEIGVSLPLMKSWSSRP